MDKPRRYPIEVEYRGQTYFGEWYVADGLLHLRSPIGSCSGPIGILGFVPRPSRMAKQMLWRLARRNDPARPFFYWR